MVIELNIQENDTKTEKEVLKLITDKLDKIKSKSDIKSYSIEFIEMDDFDCEECKKYCAEDDACPLGYRVTIAECRLDIEEGKREDECCDSCSGDGSELCPAGHKMTIGECDLHLYLEKNKKL